VLSENLSVNKKGLQKDPDEAIQQDRALGAAPDTLPKVIQLRKRIAEAVSFELVEAETEQNNNKIQGDKERKFAIYNVSSGVIRV
jgi:hypothetical protein